MILTFRCSIYRYYACRLVLHWTVHSLIFILIPVQGTMHHLRSCSNPGLLLRKYRLICVKHGYGWFRDYLITRILRDRVPDSTLINGLGRWANATGTPTPLAVIRAQPGKRWVRVLLWFFEAVHQLSIITDTDSALLARPAYQGKYARTSDYLC